MMSRPATRNRLAIMVAILSAAVLVCTGCSRTGRTGPPASALSAGPTLTSPGGAGAQPSSTPTTLTPGTSATSGNRSIAPGPGPQARYTVAPQPASGTCRYRHTLNGQPLPDPRCTPGAVNPVVRQSNLATTICRSGYTKTIRPPASITDKEKVANARSYGYIGSLSQAEYDHLISLELGGDPNSALNLWVEPPSPGHLSSQGVSNPKDQVENDLNKLVCDAVHLASRHAGTATSYLPLARAQQLIATDWTTAVTKADQELIAG